MQCVNIAAEYDTIASAYNTSWDEKLWLHTTFYTFTNHVLGGKLDTLKDAAVLELGCGGGLFCRWAASQGAARVVGVDISEQQIILAREGCTPAYGAENAGHSNIEYILGDVTAIDGAELGQFDIVLASHILCYAQDRLDLQRMLKAASSCLKRGGRFVGVRECLDSAAKGKAMMKVKGDLKGGPMFSYELIPHTDNKDQQCQDFCRCKLAYRNADGSTLDVTAFLVRESTMIELFVEAGFKVNSIGPILSCSPEGRKLFPPEFIKSLIDNFGQIFSYFDVTKL